MRRQQLVTLLEALFPSDSEILDISVTSGSDRITTVTVESRPIPMNVRFNCNECDIEQKLEQMTAGEVHTMVEAHKKICPKDKVADRGQFIVPVDSPPDGISVEAVGIVRRGPGRPRKDAVIQ